MDDPRLGNIERGEKCIMHVSQSVLLHPGVSGDENKMDKIEMKKKKSNWNQDGNL